MMSSICINHGGEHKEKGNRFMEKELM